MKILSLIVVLLCSVTNANAALPRISAADSGLNGAGRFVIQSTGQTFVPRGTNYIRENAGLHTLFAPAVYNTFAVEGALTSMEADGYNFVRVFIEHWPIVNASVGLPMTEGGLNAAYIDNVADFITRAANHNIYVMLVLSYVPVNSYYTGISNSFVTASGYYGGGINYNSYYMNLGHILAKEKYVEDFITAIENRIGSVNLSNIFAYAIDNELFYADNTFPFNQTSGLIAAADGLSYDMSLIADRQQAADANAVEYANRVTASIKNVDPDAMVTIGVFTFGAVGLPSGPEGIWPGSTPDWRRPGRPASLSLYSILDFIDIHNYPLAGC